MIPNILTTVRLLLVPVFTYFTVFADNLPAAAIIFVLSGLTDIIDGYIARHYNMITKFGMVYDPFVDKLMQITAVVCLVIIDIIPVWLLAVVLVKEVSMIITGGILYAKKIVVSSNKFGKASTVIFYAGVLAIILWKNIPSDVMMTIFVVMIGAMALAGIIYIVDIIKNYESKRVD